MKNYVERMVHWTLFSILRCRSLLLLPLRFLCVVVFLIIIVENWEGGKEGEGERRVWRREGGWGGLPHKKQQKDNNANNEKENEFMYRHRPIL